MKKKVFLSQPVQVLLFVNECFHRNTGHIVTLLHKYFRGINFIISIYIIIVNKDVILGKFVGRYKITHIDIISVYTGFEIIQFLNKKY